MDVDASFALNAEVAVAKVVEGEVIVINVVTGRYYSLEHAGTAAWVWLTDGASASDVAERMSTRYDLPADAAFADLQTLVADLLAAELIVRRAGPASADPSHVEPDLEPYAAPTITAFSDMEDILAYDPPLPSTSAMPQAWEPPPVEG